MFNVECLMLNDERLKVNGERPSGWLIVNCELLIVNSDFGCKGTKSDLHKPAKCKVLQSSF